MSLIRKQRWDRENGSSRVFALSCLFLFLLCLAVLFHGLGGAALFEPTEGRNAEVAREILVLNDWVTPHYNFIARLDKPVFFYWLVGGAYRLFGVSEWSARFPSALAALGCLFLICRLARSFLSPWAALWSGFILVTSMEYAAFSRAVIFDMTLTFFITLSLCAFYWGTQSQDKVIKRTFYLVMYAAMGFATLGKGPIGLALPGMVIFSYLFVAKKWFLLRELDFLPGCILFMAIVAPWYVWAELRNPGYIRYFLLEENFLRFFTPQFKRTGPWYYFLGVLAAGFIPWTLMIPFLIRELWRRPFDDKTVFLVLWIVSPFVFFSLSASKLPHYILPIYPPLSLLVGEFVSHLFKERPEKRGWVLRLPWLTLFFTVAVSVLILFRPDLFSHRLQSHVREAFPSGSHVLLFGALVALAIFVLAVIRHLWIEEGYLYLVSCVVFSLCFFFLQTVARNISLAHSSKELAEKSSGIIHPEDQIVLYHLYLTSLPFYLQAEKPIWVVWSGRGNRIMGSFYVAEKQPRPAEGYDKVLFTYEEISHLWKDFDRRLLVFIDKKRLARLTSQGVILPREVLQVGDVVLTTNR